MANMQLDYSSTGQDDWQDGRTLIEASDYMLQNEVACDVIFLLGDGQTEMAAHRYVMMARSPALHRLFNTHEVKTNLAVSIPDISSETFKDVLTYMYTEHVDIHGENVGSLLHAARRLEVNGLSRLCFKFLDQHMSVGNACRILEQAHRFQETGLFDKCLKFIHAGGYDVLRTHGFTDLCSECVTAVIKSDNLKAEEELVFEIMIGWATAECRRRKLQPTDANRRVALGEIVYHIRFPTMDVTYFTQKVSFRDILSEDEAVAIFQYFHGEERHLSRKFNRNERNRLKNRKPLGEQKRNTRQGKKVEMTTAEYVESRQMLRVPPSKRKQSSPQVMEAIPLTTPRSPNISRVNRFRTYDGQWKQNGPPDAISFSCSSPIVLYGIEIYGSASGTETYKLKLYLFDDMKEQVRSNDVTVTTDTIRRTYDVTFARPVRIPPRRIFTVMVIIKGSPCCKGVDGSRVDVVEGVTFEFSDSNRSSNGTDVTVGQIPGLLFNKTE
ncbi:BTBD6-like protein [Mya arenaria]|uniref:BTBD6-like protein n=1 Tax=Mya arenaria TaxID=6604 RepID=A0ABY7EDT4_MYAAR|nr:BTB/POZ domain-containing protein 3-like [Mya arenaria]WAR07097.1 BTBD6-like protein [Mya arenaria]